MPLPSLPNGAQLERSDEAEYCHAVYGVDLALDDQAYVLTYLLTYLLTHYYSLAHLPPRCLLACLTCFAHLHTCAYLLAYLRQPGKRLARRDPDQAADGLLVLAGDLTW